MFYLNQITSAGEIGIFTADASELGFEPGNWPDHLHFPNTLGNGLPFFKHRKIDYYGEFGGWVYMQDCGSVQIKVFND